MEPFVKTFAFLLLIGASSVTSVPLSSQPLEWQSNGCAKTCSQDFTQSMVRFESGFSYKYRLETETEISVENSRQQLHLEAEVFVSAHSACELSLRLRETRVKGVDEDYARALKAELESEAIQFAYGSDGRVTSVCASRDDPEWAQDVKRSVISALQMSAPSLTAPSVVMETDISGECETIYEPISEKYSKIILKKTKRLDKCANRQSILSALSPREYFSDWTSLPVTNATLECAMTVDATSGAISGVTCEEWQRLLVSGVSLHSSLNLRLEKRENGLSVERVKHFARHHSHRLLMSTRFGSDERFAHKEVSETDLQEVTRALCQQLTADSHEKAVQAVEAFPELVSALHYAPPQTIARVARSVQSGDACQTSKLWDLFLDASALAGSEGATEVLVKAYEAKREKESLFSLLSFASNPNPKAIEKLIPLLEKTETKKHVVLGISGLIHNARNSRDISEAEKREMASRALEALVKRLKSETKDSRIVGTVRAIDNIGANMSPKAVEVLMEIAKNKAKSDGVRVAAIKALSEALDERRREELLREVFLKAEESNEVRIQSYKAIVMSGVSKRQLEAIRDSLRSNSNPNVEQYVRSHQKNLKETSDPHKRQQLLEDSVEFREPSQQWFGISNNFESSFLLDALGVGVAVEGDVIHAKGGDIPRSVTANITLPAFGRELALIEVQIRQKGFDELLRQKMRQMRQMAAKGVSKEAAKEVLEFFASAHDWTTNQVTARDVKLEVGVKVDGKHVLSVDLTDAESAYEWTAFVRRMRDRLDVDSAFAFQPLNTRLRLPNANGMPIEMRVNATLVTSLKATVKADDREMEAKVAPLVALQVESGVSFAAKGAKKAVEAIVRISSSPKWESKAEIKDSRISVKITPKDRQTLIRVEGALYERDSAGNRKMMKTDRLSGYDRKVCTKSTRKPFGMEVCAEISSLPLRYEVFVEKTDRSMKSFDFTIEKPSKESRDSQVWRMAFQTPNSEIDREMSAELAISSPNSGRKEAKLAVRSPWMRWSAETSLRNEEKEQSIAVEVQTDGRKVFSLDAGLESQTRGQKRDFRPRLRLQVPQWEPISMQGSISVAKGRKNQLQINLEGNQKQFLKGSFVREGERKSNEMRVSSDISLQLPGIEVRVNGMAEKAAKQVSSDVTVEYRLSGVKSGRKESIKVSAKLQNLTQSTLTKMSAFGELTSTQFPKANFHLAYNLLRKPDEHVENELTVAWQQNLNSKIHVLHVTKLTQQSKQEKKLENTLDIEITPLNINYELRANADIRGQWAAKEGPKYAVEVVGKDRTGRKGNDVKASFDYTHVSRSPLHLTMEAVVKTSGREVVYRDSLREISDGEFKGQTSFQWQKGHKADLDYDYKMRTSPEQFHHEMDAKFRAFGREVRHSGLLRLSRHDFELKSRVNSDGNAVFDIDSRLSRNSDSRFAFESPIFAAKVSANPYVAPALAALEISAPKQAFLHKTEIEFIPKISLKLKSDSKRENRNLFNIDSHFSRSAPSRLVFSSEPMDGRFDADFLSPKKSLLLDLKSASNDWKHNSIANFEPKTRIEFKSKTELKGKPVMSLESDFNRQKKSYFSVEFPKQKSSFVANADLYANPDSKSADFEAIYGDFKHKSEFELNPKSVKIVAKSDRNRSPIQTMDYTYNRANGLHSLNSQFGKQYSLEMEANNAWNSAKNAQTIEPFVRVSGKTPKFDSQSKIAWNRNKNQITIESKNHRNGAPILDLSGRLSRDANSESSLRLVTPDLRSLLATTPSRNAKFEYNCHHIDHVTDAQWPSSEEDFRLESKTRLKNTNRFYDFSAKHSPSRETYFAVKSSPFDASALFSRREPKVKIEFTGNPELSRFPYSHVTELEVNPSQHYSLASRTDRLTAGQRKDNIVALNARYNHLDATIPSTLDLKYGHELSAKLKVQPFDRKQRFFQIETKHPKYSHVTDLQIDDKALTVKSRTDDRSGRNLAKIDSYLTPIYGEKSHFSVVTPFSSANVEYEPKSRASVDWKSTSVSYPFEHKTEIQKKSENGLKIVSKTTRNAENLLDVNSELNFDENPSHFYVKSPQIESQLWAHPSQKSAKITIKTKEIEHKSDLKVNPKERQLDFESRTENRGQILANFVAKLDAKQRKHDLEVEIPRFAVKTGFDLNRKSASVDYRSKLRSDRHLLASVAINDDNGFHADVAWDADKDPNQRLVVDLTARREGSWGQKSVFSTFSAVYAGNELKLESQMRENALIAGPHEWTVSYRPKYNPQRDSATLVMKHVIKDQEMQCNAIYSEGQALKFGAKLNAKMGENAATGEREIGLSLETTAPKNPDLELKVTLNERHSSLKSRNAEVFAEVKALRTSIGQQFSISGHVKRDQSDDQKVKINFAIETPSIGEQTVNIVVNGRDKQMTGSASNRNGKQLEARAKIGANSADFELKSNVRGIPSLRTTLTVIPGQEVALILDADSLRKVDFWAKKSGQSVEEGVELTVRLETPFWPKMETKNKLKFNSRDIEIEMSAKYDDKSVFASQLAAQQRSGVWSGNAHVTRSGAELASAALQSSFSADSLSYALSAKSGKWSGIHASLTSQKIGRNERKVFVKMCSQNEINCVDIKSDVIYAKHYSRLPFEKAWLSVTKMGTNFEIKTSLMEQLDDKRAGDSLLGLTTGQAVSSRVRNQFVVSINSHSLGFDSVMTSRDSQSSDSSLKLYFPSNRWFQLKTDFSRKQSLIRANTQLVSDASAQPLFESALELQRPTSGELKADLRMSSNRFKRSPKSVSFSLRRDDKTAAKLTLDLSRDPNHALTIDAKLESKPMAGNTRWTSGSDKNTTLSLALSTRDRSLLDFALRGHVSRESIGLSVRNVNRRGEERNGFYFARFLPENRFEGVFRDSRRGYRVSGQFGKSREEISTDVKVYDERTREERDVRLSFSGKCVVMETRFEQTVDKKYHFCVNNERNEKTVALDVTSRDGKSAGFDLQVETSGEKAVKVDVHWSPEVMAAIAAKLRESRDSQFWTSEAYDVIPEEVLEELRHKASVVSKQLSDDVIEPMAALLSDQMTDILQEMWRNFGPKMGQTLDKYQQLVSDVWQTVRRFGRQMAQSYDHVIPQSLQNWFQRAVKSARKQCKRSEVCYKALYALENYGSDALLDLFYSAALETLKTTHRVVMTTSGRLIRTLPSPPEWMQTYVEDYKQTVFETIRQIIDSNEDFRQFFDHLSRLLSELLRENSANIQWSAVRESARGVRDIVFSRKAFQSSHRVLVWDPRRGHISLELRAPGPLVHSRRLRSVMNDMKKSWKSAEPMKKWQKKWQQIKEYVKSMF